MGTRLFSVVCLIVLVPSAALAVCESGPVSSGFDSDLEGWTAVSASFAQQPTGGNPGGLLYVDNSETLLAAIIAPASFRGDLRPCDGGTFSFDGRMLGTGGSGYASEGADYGSLRISGPGGSMTVDLLPGGPPSNAPPTATWGSYSVPFTAATFNRTQPQFEAVLANVTEVRLGVEALFGAEIQGIDNFRLAPTPVVPVLSVAGRLALVLAVGLLAVLASKSPGRRPDPRRG